MKPDIVLVSGGMDSLLVVAKAFAKNKHLAFIHFTYGQRTAQKELECFNLIADHYQVPAKLRHVVDLKSLANFGGSSLTDKKIEVAKNSDLSVAEIPTSYVPFRNAQMLAITTAWAEVLDSQYIYIGANEEDSPGYPDCRPAFYEAFNKLIKTGTKEGKIKILTPVIGHTKAQIVKEIIEYRAPVELTWSCYENSDKACGICDSCQLRLKGFKINQVKDPITYQ